MELFRVLTKEEERQFRQAARDNYNYHTMNISCAWHPIYIDECNKMVQEEYERIKIREFNRTNTN
jgi:hypothetical protein